MPLLVLESRYNCVCWNDLVSTTGRNGRYIRVLYCYWSVRLSLPHAVQLGGSYYRNRISARLCSMSPIVYLIVNPYSRTMVNHANFRSWSVVSQTLAALFLFYSTTTLGVWDKSDTFDRGGFLAIDLIVVSFVAYLSYGLYMKGHVNPVFIFFNLMAPVTLGITFICLGHFGVL